ncbi:MAG: alpha/beta hydrolase [Lachnospiraceae bacterium]|nr:alpha/beta hydrolase [Lachnospiraceae bacterium]
MALKKLLGMIAAVIGVIAAVELGIAVYFYRRTMIRSNAKTDRTIKMAGTEWNQHMPFIQKRKEAMLAQPHSDQWVMSEDGLRLHGTWFPRGDCKKVVICFHGYTSQGMKDYIGLSGYYLNHGYSMLLVDERAHGESEGKYIGFGCLDRQDALKWIDWVIRKCGEDTEILLHGTSMGAATVLMTSGLELPAQVKGIISDCAFTSPKEVFSHVLKSMYHMPAFPTMQLADFLNRKLSGYGLDECNAAREVKKAKVPILFIHGSGDTFVPCSMCETIYENCASPKKKLIVEGAAHAESYYKDTDAYENALTEFIGEL